MATIEQLQEIRQRLISIRDNKTLDGDDVDRSENLHRLFMYPAMMVPATQYAVIEAISDCLPIHANAISFMGSGTSMMSCMEFDQFYLIPIREYKEEKDKGNKVIVKLQRVEGESQLVAELSRYARISLSVLDLVSFNEQGKATTNIFQTMHNHPNKYIIQKNMMIRYENILSRILSFKSKNEKIQSTNWSNEEKLKFKKDFCHPFEMGDEKITKHPIINANNPSVIDFSITRVRRYKDPYAKDLLSLFMNYLSRPGYPMDFILDENN